MQLIEIFPNEESAVKWFKQIRWSTGERCCGHCGSVDTYKVKNAKPMPYKCRGCGKYFSVRTGSMLESSRLPLRKWVFEAQLYVTNLKGVSSMNLHRDLNITQKTAWLIHHRLRDAWDESGLEKFVGAVDVNEFADPYNNHHGYKNIPAKSWRLGRGPRLDLYGDENYQIGLKSAGQVKYVIPFQVGFDGVSISSHVGRGLLRCLNPN